MEAERILPLDCGGGGGGGATTVGKEEENESELGKTAFWSSVGSRRNERTGRNISGGEGKGEQGGGGEKELFISATGKLR